MTAKIEEVQQVENSEEKTAENVGEQASEQKISEENLGKLNGIRGQMEEMTRMIGTLEVQKSRISFQHLNASDEMKRIIQTALVEVGVAESDLSQYRINMETGIVEKVSAPQ